QHRLQETLSAQPEWSHLPLIIMAAERRSSRPPANLDEFIHSTHAVRLLRPVRKLTLVSSVRAALNSRARQYQVRDELFQRRRVEEALRQSEERYRRLVGLLPVGVYTCSAPSGAITFFNEQAVRLWGRAPK